MDKILMTSGDLKWHRIVVRDPLLLSGPSTKDFLNQVIALTHPRWMVVHGLEGAYAGLRGLEGISFTPAELLDKIAQATQYDWGFIFFYATESDIPAIGPNEQINISNADVTVQLVDDQYFYVYTSDQEFSDQFLQRFPSAEHRAAELRNLPIPS